jgi:hypothetical protein
VPYTQSSLHFLFLGSLLLHAFNFKLYIVCRVGILEELLKYYLSCLVITKCLVIINGSLNKRRLGIHSWQLRGHFSSLQLPIVITTNLSLMNSHTDIPILQQLFSISLLCYFFLTLQYNTHNSFVESVLRGHFFQKRRDNIIY